MQDLERDLAALRVTGQKDARVPSPADLTFDLVTTIKGLAHQGQHIAPNSSGS